MSIAPHELSVVTRMGGSTFAPLIELAFRIRRNVVHMTHRSRASHVGSCLSAADLMAALYAPGGFLRHRPHNPDWEGRDRFILSKGHAAAGLYATLAESGYFPRHWLNDYCRNGAPLGGHATSKGVPGVELSTGSLGHGLSVGLGMAMGLKATGQRVVVMLSDGELNEGSNWEAILQAPHFGVGNLIAIVDYNKIQSLGRVEDVMPLGPLPMKFQSFGWAVCEIDGHDPRAILSTLSGVPYVRHTPTVVIAHTVKGKGVSFMEDSVHWHYKSPNDTQLEDALAELEIGYKEALQ